MAKAKGISLGQLARLEGVSTARMSYLFKTNIFIV